MQNKSTAILCRINNKNQKAVINLENKEKLCSGTIRLYNITSNALSGILSVGLLSDGKVEKAILRKTSDTTFAFQFERPLQLDAYTCALVQTYEGESSPIFVGASNEKLDYSLESRLASVASSIDSELSIEKAKRALDENGIDFDSEIKCEIEKTIDREMCKTENCKDCNYKKAFYQEESVVKEKEVPTFYSSLMPQLDELFKNYERDDELEAIIPNSKWVRVDFNNDGNYYVLGLIFEDDDIKYVCYGVPGIFSTSPPKEFEGLSKWLPLQTEKPFESGYWIIYQNAETGENMNIEVI